jgi:hypothetical protein
MYRGDIRLGDTIDVKFCTVTTTGAPTVLAGSPVISAYVGNSVTQITAGITLTVDFDGVVGLNHVRVVASSGNGFATAANVQLVITTGTVGGTSVVGCVSVRIEARSALLPTVAARTLDVSAGGEAGVDWANVGTPGSTVGLTATTVATLTTYTGNTPQTGDAFARLGAPAGASVSADVAAVKVDTAAILVDTGTTLDGRIPAALVGGRMDSSVGAMAAGVVTAAAVATGAIDADALAADAATEIRSLASGTRFGTTTTMVDAARTEADTDYWKGAIIAFTSGTLLGQTRLVTAFTPATDTITFTPATTVAVGTHTYELLPSGHADVQAWVGSVPNALVSGRVDASVGAMAANVMTAAAAAADLGQASQLTTATPRHRRLLDTELRISKHGCPRRRGWAHRRLGRGDGGERGDGCRHRYRCDTARNWRRCRHRDQSDCEERSASYWRCSVPRTEPGKQRHPSI